MTDTLTAPSPALPAAAGSRARRAWWQVADALGLPPDLPAPTPPRRAVPPPPTGPTAGFRPRVAHALGLPPPPPSPARPRAESGGRARAAAGLVATVPATLALLAGAPAGPAAAGPVPAGPVPAAALPAAALPAAALPAAPRPAAVAPAAGAHVVQPGETLSGLAARYGTTVPALAQANGLPDPDRVRAGLTLTIPAGAPPGTAAPPGGGGAAAGLPARLAQSPTRLAYVPVFDRWAAANGIPADLLKAMTWLESGWQNGQVSSTGAVGIGQLMPDTVDFVEDLIGRDLDPGVAEDNIRMSARYLRWLLGRYGSADAALAAYYQGPASVERSGRFPDTETYVANVLALRARF